MSQFAIVSDIHANLEALTAVLEDIDDQGIERIICLGDVVGYGPDPVACLDIAMERFEFCLRGNHEHAVICGPSAAYNEVARQSLEWTRAQLKGRKGLKLMKFVQSFGESRTEKPYLFVHGSPRDHVFEYVIQSQVAAANIDKLPSGVNICFVGHTHLPAIFEEGEAAVFISEDNRYKLPLGKRCIINVGSVGQPRDKNPAACYAVVEGEHVRHRRVDYPFAETAKKIKAIPELDDYLADRLAHGS